jgi:outer membrane receptor protein involved in Fe transport
VSAVFGYESRELESDYRPDASAQAADRTGAGGPSVALAGGYDVKEYFLELGVPVTDNFNLEIGARFADYSTDNDTDAFKLGGYWQINDQVSVRGTFQTATRHGGISELYRGQGSSLTDLDPDPCGTDPETGLGPTYTAQECARTGLAAVDYGSDLKSPADQYNILTGGNPNLVPEESESVTLGVVWTPASVPGLSVTLDYFDIEITDGIGTIPASTSLIQCLETGNPTFCGLVERDPIAGTLWVSPGQIITTNTNVSESALTGYDITFTYPLETPFGVLDLKGISTITDSDTFIAIPGAEELQCAGYYGKSCGKNPTPEFAGNYSASLTRGDFDYVLGLRFLGETEDLNTVDIDIEDKTYLDFTVNYQFSDSLRFSVGASNILDEDPVYTSAAGTAPGNGNTFPGYFDALGTYIFINATFEM